ncbi:hypothetical protein BYT27DRAFT_7089557, partial [Phlegmacium glaucopus]
MRCFTHILNLVAKSILKQFDLPKAKAGEALSAAVEALSDLAGDIEIEEASMGRELAEDDDSDDDEDGLADPRDEMTDDEITELDESLQPVRLVLVKVNSLRKLAFTIKNSMTMVLPEWMSILDQHAEASKVAKTKPLSRRMMPRDVSTRWNSTFDMVKFALAY